jgi:hypothetical protein
MGEVLAQFMGYAVRTAQTHAPYNGLSEWTFGGWKGTVIEAVFCPDSA